MVRKIITRDYKKHSKDIYDFYDVHRRMPTFSELLKIFDVNSKDTVSRIVQTLVDLNFILKDKRGYLLPVADEMFKKVLKPSGFKPKPKNTSYGVLRMLGLVEAGFPSFVDIEDTDVISLEEWLIGDRSATFMLKVKGESMRDAGIMDGDYVIVERGKEPKIGSIVLANIDSGWTLKYYKKDKQGVYLEPANKNFKIIRPKQDLQIPAVVVSVVRKYGK